MNDGDFLASVLPHDARVIRLRDGGKEPTSLRGHHAAVGLDEFIPLGTNVGWVLDGQFLLVDIDRMCEEARFLARGLDEMSTWRQRTPHGRHWVYRVPPGYRLGNGKLRDNQGQPYADIKALGYLVAPGSVVVCDGHKHPDGVACANARYVIESSVDPIPAPTWVLAMHEASVAPGASVVGSEAERDGIPSGEHDAFLTSVAGFLRGRQGLSEAAIAEVLQEGPLAALRDVDEARPYTDTDFARIARSAARYTPKTADAGALLAEGWVGGAEAAAQLEETTWLLPYFVPKGEVTLLYGAGGLGKSSWFSWLLARFTRMRQRCGVLTVEEPFSRFAARCSLYDADFDYLYGRAVGGDFKFRKHTDQLIEAIAAIGLDVLYVDALKAHFSSAEGEDAGAYARANMTPLIEVARATGCTILGTFHETKEGVYAGSPEILNVPRVVIEAKERGDRVVLSVHKSNYERPPYRLVFRREAVPYHGHVQTVLHPDRPTESVPATMLRFIDEGTEDIGTVQLSEVRGTKEQAAREVEGLP